nr:hypothetical protein [Paramyrothecium roridum]
MTKIYNNEAGAYTEEIILRDGNILGVKTFNVAEAHKAPEFVVAVALTALPEEANDDLTSVLKRVRKATRDALKEKYGSEGKLFLPKQWLVVDGIPLTATGAVDEDALLMELLTSSSMALKLTSKQRRDLVIRASSTLSIATDCEKEEHRSEVEIVLCSLWSKVLRVEAQNIQREDNFIKLGGDSVLAVELASHAQGYGLRITVADILMHPRLAQMAEKVVIDDSEADPITKAEPFDLLPRNERSAIQNHVKDLCRLSADQAIEDIYPCTTLQEGFMALGVKQPGSYVHRQVWRLPDDVDCDRFKEAVNQAVQQCGNLRTRVVLSNGSAYQAIVQGDDPWIQPPDGLGVASVISFARESVKMSYGDGLSRCALIQEGESTYFVWIIHHSVFDGMTARIMLDMIHQIYMNDTPKPVQPYSDFIRYVHTRDPEASKEFWRAQLNGAGQATFPSMAAFRSSSASRGRVTRKQIPFRLPDGTTTTKATLLRAAWAVVLAKYCDTDDVCFGATVSGRNAPLAGCSEIPGPMIATVPIRAQINSQRSVGDFLESVQSQASAMIPFEQYGLQNIAKLGPDAKEACDFSSLLVIQPNHALASTADTSSTPILVHGDAEREFSDNSMQDYFSYPLVLQTHVGDHTVELDWTYYEDVVAESQIEALSHHYEAVLNQLVDHQDQPLGSLNLSGPWDMERAIQLRGEEVEVFDTCVHEVFEIEARRRPDASAILAWDRSFTYKQLNEAANRLANHLHSAFNTQPDELIIVCFEKSAWFFVSILAINKAGGAWVPLDPSHPPQRQQQITQQTKARLALTSPATADICKEIVSDIVEVSPILDERLELADAELSEHPPQTNVTARNAVYVLFTSGSTGVPKGFVMEHGSVVTSQKAIARRLQLTPRVRILQFASYVFDLCIGEIIAPLISGATLCIPSEEIRLNNITNFISEMNVNWVFLTPAFVRTIKPKDVPTLELVLLAGEAVGQDILDTWVGKVRLVNGWGPAETCVFSTLHEWKSTEEISLTVGRPVGGFCWIVDPQNPHQLAPIGTLGEVVIQGPTILREYLANPDLTAATTSSVPTWAPKSDQQHWNRFYKSGDLCFYNPDGTIQFSGRKDTQVKIRGLRVELGEVEHHVRSGLSNVKQVVVEVFKTEAGANLAAFFSATNETRMANSASRGSEDEIFASSTREQQDDIAALVGQLSVTLPRYMIPTLFIPCRFMPAITSTKIDRKELKRALLSLSKDQLDEYALTDKNKRPPETHMESRFQRIWADLLKIELVSIGRDDSFLKIGGDSITAIHLVAKAREAGISLSVKDIFDDPRLSSISLKSKDLDRSLGRQKVAPFSLLQSSQLEALQDKAICASHGFKPSDVIEDAYPCTKLQEGLIALASKFPGSYVTKYVYNLPNNVDIERFKAAWTRTVEMCANLRMRVINLDGTSVQIILKDDLDWEIRKGGTVEGYMKESHNLSMGFGDRLCRYALIEQDDGKNYFVWMIHHSIHDGWTMRIVLDVVLALYRQEAVPPLAPYAEFINYLIKQDSKTLEQYWKDQLHEARPATFPPHIPPGAGAVTRMVDKVFPVPKLKDNSITKATVLRAAWSLVLAKYSSSDDVTFGSTVSGRQAPLAGLDTMCGPAIATVAVRIRHDGKKQVSEFLKDVQTQANEMIPFEQYGLQSIKQVSAHAREACDFTSLLVIQPGQQITHAHTSEDAVLVSGPNELLLAEEAMENYFNYPLVVMTYIFDDRVEMRLAYNAGVLEEPQLEALAHQLDTAIQQLIKHPNKLLEEVSLVSKWDLDHAIASSRITQPTESCTHWEIAKQIQERPDDLAVAAWDAELTYHQVGQFATRLAARLQELGVGPNVLLPICFPKSAWAAVVMVAIEMAGGAFVPLDPNAPAARYQSILEDTAARLVVTTPLLGSAFEGMPVQVFAVDVDVIHNLPDPSIPLSVNIQPSDPCFVLFTSGSTGKPKGMVMQHDSICSSADAYGADMGIGPGTRVFQFSAFTFDVGVLDILVTLIRGGTVCMPSDHDRINNLAAVMRSFKANWVFLTPSVADLLSPTDLPEMKAVALGGEAISKQSMDRWKDSVSLHGLYGPAEASICAWRPFALQAGKSTNIGKPLNSAFWVVEPEDLKQLVPVGCVGELIIQGPMLARGYLNVSAEVAANWIESAHWLPSVGYSSTRAYRTGDLVRRNHDGSFDYLGRKDTQVKLHGQRVELGEIESRIQENLPAEVNVLVDVVKASDYEGLTAYIWYSAGPNCRPNKAFKLMAQLTAEMRKLISGLDNTLGLILPSYMIPHTYLVFEGIPQRNANGKVDRKALSTMSHGLSLQDRMRFAPETTANEPPATNEELSMQSLWAKILNIQTEVISRNSNFLRLGGDSINAIKLVTLAQQHDFNLTVATIFQNPQLSDMAAVAGDTSEIKSYDAEPFSLLPADRLQSMMSQIQQKCQLSQAEEIQDAFPCSPLQQGLMYLTAKTPGAYIAKNVYRLPSHIDVDKFKNAWELMHQVCDNLRTRVIISGKATVQAILKSEAQWEDTSGMALKTVLATIQSIPMTYGTPLSRQAIVSDDTGTYFVWFLHHTVFDGFCMNLMFEILNLAYRDQTLPTVYRFANFIHYVEATDTDAADLYWKGQLQDVKKTSFPPTTINGQTEKSSTSRIYRIKLALPDFLNMSVTIASTFRAAWAVMIARYCKQDDVCFATTNSGRQAPVAGLEAMLGPTVATVPIRLNIDAEQDVSDFLSGVQEQANAMAVFEHYGLQNISKVSEAAKDVCDFSALFVVQPIKQFMESSKSTDAVLEPLGDDKGIDEDLLDGYFSYPLVFQCLVGERDMELLSLYNPDVLDDIQLHALSCQFGHVAEQLATLQNSKLGEVVLSSEWATTFKSTSDVSPPEHRTLTMPPNSVGNNVAQVADDQADSRSENMDSPPFTSMEIRMQSLWAQLLEVSPDSISRYDSFLEIGGDSIAAIQLVTAARDENIDISINDILTDPRLSAVAAAAVELAEPHGSVQLKPFALVSETTREFILRPETLEMCGLPSGTIIEDAYPCTKLQEGLMALSVKQPGSYIAKYVYKLGIGIERAQVRAAWNKTVAHCPIMRTRIIQMSGESIQIVANTKAEWNLGSERNLDGAIHRAHSVEMTYGTPLNEYSIVKGPDGSYYFVWVSHHAVHDGWTNGVIMNAFYCAYRGLSMPKMESYASFIKYTIAVDSENTANYWKKQLQNAQRAPYPPAASKKPSETRTVKRVIEVSGTNNATITTATMIRAAWALVLSKYCDTDDVCFGAAISGRNAPIAGIDTVAGPIIATIPIRLQISPEETVANLLKTVQNQALEMVPYEQFGLQRMIKLDAEIRDACDFSSLLVIQPVQHLDKTNETAGAILTPTSNVNDGHMQNYFTYPLVATGLMYEDHIELLLIYDSAVLSDQEMELLSCHFSEAITQMTQNSEMLLKDVNMIVPEDMEQAIAWNCFEPEIIDSTVHGLVSELARKNPNAPAVAAWDRHLTYSELDIFANKLAHHLVTSLAVQPGEFVQLCFDKSAWSVVASLAVNKAGAAWVPIDPSHPVQRLQHIAQQTQAKLALTSAKHSALCRQLFKNVFEVHEAALESMPSSHINQALPTNAAYALFTSGSTGTPKGLVMEHRSVCTSQTTIARRLGLDSHVRLLQFASAVFDLCIGEMIGGLLAGACLYIPSEEVRMNNLSTYITSNSINWVFLTPSVARTLVPEELPGLELLLMCGEAAGQDFLEQWLGKVRLVNGWGPAETCVFSSIHEWRSIDEGPLTVGKPVAANLWIVDPQDHTKLAPTGTVGEVMIQGPTILREYLADPIRTKNAIVSELPAWIPRRDAPSYNRLYKSGDLCAYKPDGTLRFVRRKDTQVKIRGLRIELGEIENHIRQSLPGLREVVVTTMKQNESVRIVAYLCFKEGEDNEEIFADLSEGLRETVIRLQAELNMRLPPYMVPKTFIPCNRVPYITSTKIDRRILVKLTEALNHSQLAKYSLAETDKRAPETEMELVFQEVWAEVLGIPRDNIGRDDSFLTIGGDSISAIRLVTHLRNIGYSIVVQDIFDDARLSSLAAKAVKVDEASTTSVAPFSLLPGPLREAQQLTSVIAEVSQDPHISIEDAFPCTKLQEGLIALAARQPGSYIAKHVYKLGPKTNIDQFRKAWELALGACPNLRTRIFQVDETPIQVIVREDPTWEPVDGLDVRSYLKKTQEHFMGFGTRLCRYALIHQGTGTYFALAIHHSIFDGWSMPLIMGVLNAAYHDIALPKLHSYAGFVDYTMNLNHITTGSYWKKYLQGASKASFPVRDPSTPPNADGSKSLRKTIKTEFNSDLTVTRATLLRAAWGLLLARYCETDDVTFGVTVSGRNAPVPDLATMPGLVVATVPSRIKLNEEKTIKQFLEDIQKDSTNMIPHEQFGIQNMAKLGPSYKDACNFSSLLAIQPVQQMMSMGSPEEQILLSGPEEEHLCQEVMQKYFSYPLVAQCHLLENQVDLVLIYDTNVLSDAAMEAMSEQFDAIVQQLEETDTRRIGDVSISGTWDLEKAKAYNKQEIELFDACIHDLIAEKAASQPTHEALYTSSSSITYADLDVLTSKLAAHLVDLGVGPGKMVPFCFEKSSKAVVAMLAILKAGGAFVPLDPKHPQNRRKALIEEIRADIVVTSDFVSEECQGLVPKTVILSDAFVRQLLKSKSNAKLPFVRPSDAAYVLFTSGSTGKPKGIIMEHSAFSTSTLGQGRIFRLDQHSRVFQFSNYIFDGSLGEIFTPLAHGSTVCIPTETERLQSAGDFMTQARVTTAMLTPSFVRTLSPAKVTSLQTLVLGGEAPTRDLLAQWRGHVRLINGYGPAEACNYCATHVFSNLPEEVPKTIGSGFNSACWIVEPNNYQRLTPIGCTGELMVQGHVLARAYLNDSERTQKSFVQNVQWLSETQGPNKFYRTGDLVKYNSEGKLIYLGRKDTQVKLRGQRLELAEIEYHVQHHMPGAEHVAVEVLRRETGDSLIGFVSYPQQAITNSDDLKGFFVPNDAMADQLQTLTKKLNDVLPRYMVPSAILVLRDMPFISSMKLDRKGLQEMVASLSAEELNALSLPATHSSMQGSVGGPETTMERQIQKIWADALHLPVEIIGRDDSFLSIGGDSITAIQVVAQARDAGINIKIDDLFTDARLRRVAEQATLYEGHNNRVVEPFSLISHSIKNEILSGTFHHECQLSEQHRIVDAYPCTSLQEGLMVLSTTQPGSYIAKYVYALADGVDQVRLVAAWSKAMELSQILRTRIVLVGDRSMQLVVDGPPQWQIGRGSLRSLLDDIKELRMTYGQELCHNYIVEEDSGKRYFVMAMHHSLHDGWSFRLALTLLDEIYRGQPKTVLHPYVNFVRYTMEADIEATQAYWTKYLEDAKRATLPATATTNGDDGLHLTRALRRTVEIATAPNPSITKATILRAAWAIVLARYCSTDDVCFGTTVSGRHASVAGLENMPGPTIATVPVRVQMDSSTAVQAFLQQVQTQAFEMVQHEQFGLNNISKLSPAAKEACDLTSLLVVQPSLFFADRNGDGEKPLLSPVDQDELPLDDVLQGYFSYPLVIQAHLLEKSIEIVLIYDSGSHGESQMTALSYQLERVIQQLSTTENEMALGSIEVCGPWDLAQAMAWNMVNIPEANSCVHDLISAQVARSPQREAIYTTEGSMSYAEMDSLATKFGAHLQYLGVRPGVIVPFCMEKSAMAIVAMIGILKSGGAFVPLDPTAPTDRRSALMTQLATKYLVVSPTTLSLCEGLAENVIEFSKASMSTMSQKWFWRRYLAQKAVPNDNAYILFTSGSTGTPKGVNISHGAISSALLAMGEPTGAYENSRVLQFANYVFDASIFEIFRPLLIGGTICVPSDTERMQDATGFIESAKVNHALLTPSFLKTLRPERVPSLKTLVLGGEAPSREVIQTWASRVDLRNAYGPTEGCIMALAHRYSSSFDNPTTIGRLYAHKGWIVEADNHNKLAPIGCTGELVIQGYAIAHGYLNNAEKTAESFIDTLDWLPRDSKHPGMKLYKTGDLVRYNAQGGMDYLGRKDTQVKIRGQRIELGEIEYQVSNALSEIQHVVVDVVRRQSKAFLVAFVSFTTIRSANPTTSRVERLEMTPKLRELFGEMHKTVSAALPSYMVPNFFIPIHQMPKSSAEKIDRKALLQNVAEEDLAVYAPSLRRIFREPTNEIEFVLRVQWAHVLDVAENTISIDDNFYDLGGDSIKIVTLVKAITNKYNIPFTMSIINSKQTTITGLAKFIQDAQNGVTPEQDSRPDLLASVDAISNTPWASNPSKLLERPVTKLRDQARVFLTGGTGFLGTEILRQLLHSPSIGKVIALVRAKSSAHGLDRIRNTARIAGWWDDKLNTKLEVWQGDLSKSYLGLAGEQWARLHIAGNEQVDAIIHNGAIVNWNADFEKLHGANVESTSTLLQATITSDAQPKFVFVSGGVKAASEDDRAASAARFSGVNGYVQTKFVSECIIEDVYSKLPPGQNRVSIVKPGRIIGTVQDGVSNTDDFLWRTVAGAAALHFYPIEPDNHFMEIEDVSSVADSVIGQITAEDGISPFMNVDRGMSVATFWNQVNAELEVPCKPLSWDEWMQRAMAQMNDVGDKHPLWPVQHFLGRLGSAHGEAIQEHEELGRQHMAVRRSVRYLRDIGFIQSSAEKIGTVTDHSVIKRVHMS